MLKGTTRKLLMNRELTGKVGLGTAVRKGIANLYKRTRKKYGKHAAKSRYYRGRLGGNQFGD